MVVLRFGAPIIASADVSRTKCFIALELRRADSSKTGTPKLRRDSRCTKSPMSLFIASATGGPLQILPSVSAYGKVSFSTFAISQPEH
jgi:hypothetical protein